ncbi:Amidase 1 [Madurella mycetomatis]|uniref:Amidase 1 n=1 Tax=Madurella mycetomatis TaxID=100816 RepID=A0A175VS33_9PEZI|nr:Amidase 1 [Madurella mycetomatis]KXX74084.1 Amidase 1 [Madurella mycetomatis]
MKGSRNLFTPSLRLFTISIIAAFTTASAELVSTGFSVSLNGVYYFVSPFSSGKVEVPRRPLHSSPDIFGFKPVTVVQNGPESSDLAQLFRNWTAVDDVYQMAFSEVIFLADPESEKARTNLTVTERDIVHGFRSSVIPLKSHKIPSGPYFLEVATGSLHPVYRLYDDSAGAFTEPLIPTPDGKFQSMSAKIPGSSSLTIGVPSRLYFTKTARKPLAGVRLGVKDIYRLAGVKGSNGNRAWYNLYPASNVTAPAIQRLVDAGAQVIGLQKTAQFANGEFATADWVDYHAPFNPRGDGYQDAASSSSGGGASVAAYEWLDLAIGSDTGGSIRGPAGVQGLFGNRPSHGLVSLEHVMPLSPTLDTPGFLVRDPYLWDAANAALYGKNYTSLSSTRPTYPNKIYTIDFPTSPDTPAGKILLDFADALAEFVGGNTTALDLASEWSRTRPVEAGNATFPQFFNTTYVTIITKEQTSLVRDPFYRDYAAAHQSRKPFINPVPLARWAYGDSLPPAALPQAYAAKSAFMAWFNTHILPPSVPPSAPSPRLLNSSSTLTATTPRVSTCSSSLILYPAFMGEQFPRDEYFGAPGVPFGFHPTKISSFAEVPDSVFPLGEVAGWSRITGREELLPVGVDIMAARGCDGLVVRLAQDLVEKGIVRVPRTGATLEGGGGLVGSNSIDQNEGN